MWVNLVAVASSRAWYIAPIVGSILDGPSSGVHDTDGRDGVLC